MIKTLQIITGYANPLRCSGRMAMRVIFQYIYQDYNYMKQSLSITMMIHPIMSTPSSGSTTTGTRATGK